MENNKKTLNLFEAFAGIGSQYKALKKIAEKKNWIINQVGMIEWFIPAIIGYESIHHNDTLIRERENDSNHKWLENLTLSKNSKTKISQAYLSRLLKNDKLKSYLISSKHNSNNYFDICSVKGKDLPKNIDIFTYSFPCQDISNQGKQKGFNKGSNTRSGLLWQVERILSEIHKDNPKHLPKYLLMENVKAIINYKHINTFNEWLNYLEKFGYESKWYCLNAKDFGSAQNRTRVFAISVLKDFKNKVHFEFPKFEPQAKSKKTLLDIINKDYEFEPIWNEYKLKEKVLTSNNIKKYEIVNYTNFSSENHVYDINYNGPTLTATGALSRIKLLFDNHNIRTMKPDECVKYMGFDYEDYLKLKSTDLISDNNIILLCGNSISVEVLETIFNEFKF